jgi:hypothetical protein
MNTKILKKARIFIILSLTISSCILFGQRTLIIEGTSVIDNSTESWNGVNIPRSTPATFTYRNNFISTVNSSGYLLQAGDENQGITNNNLEGEMITGNKLIWNGTDMKSITHGIFTGYNINAVIKYNYLNKVPMSIIRKSNGMTNTSGGVAYNIVNNPLATAVVVKGINNVNIFNNTFYSTQTYSNGTTGTWRGLVDIYRNTDITPTGSSTGTKIFNNIFYTKNQILNINLYETADTGGFRSDYNLFYCESGAPLFKIGSTTYTFTQWQELGYDTHSIIMNPNFLDFTNFVPASPLKYGTNLGTTWQTGLATNTTWEVNKTPLTENQSGTWQVGAYVYKENSGSSTIPKKATIYPNPVHRSFNVLLPDSTAISSTLKLSDITGKTVFVYALRPGSNQVEIPGNINSGLYIARLQEENSIRLTQKLIIIN